MVPCVPIIINMDLKIICMYSNQGRKCHLNVKIANIRLIKNIGTIVILKIKMDVRQKYHANIVTKHYQQKIII